MAEKKPDSDRVKIMIPYVEGDDPEVTVGINGVFTKIQKGVPVDVSQGVAEVLQRSFKNQQIALERRRKLKKQVTDL